MFQWDATGITTMKIKDEKLVVKISSDDKRELAELALEQDRPASQIVREAVKEKIARSRAIDTPVVSAEIASV